MTFIDDSGNAIQYDGPFALTKQAANFFDFKIKGDYSVDFLIDNNSVNRGVLNYYGAQQVNSPAFSKNAFNLVDKGNIIARGYIVIKGSNDKSIKCFFVSGNSNWFQIFAIHLKDINFDDKYTVLMSAVDTQKAATEGIIFPLVDWAYNGQKRGYWFINTSMTNYLDPKKNAIQEMFPCVYLHTVVEQMAVNLGVKITGTLTSDPLYKSIIITPDGPDLNVPDSMIRMTIVNSTLSANQVFSIAASGNAVLQLNTVSTGSSTQFDTANYRYRCNKTGTYKIWGRLNGSGADFDTVDFALRTNGAALFTSIIGWDSRVSTTVRVINEFYVNLNAGDYIEIIAYNNSVGTYNFTVLSTSYINFELQKDIPAVLSTGNYANNQNALTPYVLPNCIIPDITCLELVKFLSIYFGAICSYEESSKTLSMNLISRMKKETATDWSDFYNSHETNYQNGSATNNYIQTKDVDDENILNYNQQSLLRYGGANINTSFTIQKQRDVYEMPFAGSWDDNSKTSLGAFMPYIKFYDLKDNLAKSYSITSVTNSAGTAVFTGAAGQPYVNGDLVRIANTGVYDGYGIVSASSGTTFTLYGVDYISTSVGFSNIVDIGLAKAGNRLLIVRPGSSIVNSGFPSGGFIWYYYSNTFSVTSIDTQVTSTTGAIAWYDKPIMGLTIDINKESLSMSQVLNRNYNNTIDEIYLRPIKSIYNNPLIKAKMLLPESQFQSYNFTNFIYLKTKTLEGYFMVASIVNYEEGTKEVEVNLYML